MTEGAIRMLLVEDNKGDARLVQAMLEEAGQAVAHSIVLQHSERLDAARLMLEENRFDVVLLDLTLPDSHGLETLHRMRAVAPHLPIIVMSGLSDQSQAVAEGAQDYLVKGEVNSNLLVRAVRYALERRRAEVAKQQSERRFRALIEHISDAILLLSATGKVIYASPSTVRVLGYDFQSLAPADPFSIMHPDDEPLARTTFNQLIQKPHDSVALQVRAKHADGHYCWIDAIGINLLDDPGVEAIVATFRDITAARQAHEALQQYARRLEVFQEIDRAILAARSPEAVAHAALSRLRPLVNCQRASVVLFDLQGNSAQLVAVLADDASGPAEGRLVPLDQYAPDLQASQARVIDDLSELPSRSDVQQQLLEIGLHSLLTTPLIVEGELLGELNLGAARRRAFGDEQISIAGEVANQLAVATQQARLRAALQAHTEELEQRVQERTAELQTANQELEAFSYSVSHDLRAPLRAVDGFARILMEDFSQNLNEEGLHYLRRVQTNVLRMAQLIDDLLAFARLSRQLMQQQRLDTDRLARQVIDELQGEVGERQVDFRIADLPICIGDAALIKQAFANLISNALKYSQRQPATVIEIGSYPAPETGADGRRMIVIFVKDNGIGFDMRYADKLFGVFQRLHRADEYEGTGVGLAIVKRIITRHNGKVWAESEPNKGATFYFSLEGVPRVDR